MSTVIERRDVRHVWLHHLTLNTLAVERASQDKLDRDTMNRLSDIMDPEAGHILGFHIRLFRRRVENGLDAATYFEIAHMRAGHLTPPFALGWTCAGPTFACSTWRLTAEALGALHEPLQRAGLWPPTLPVMPRTSLWLAVLLLPCARRLTRERLGVLREIARAIAWSTSKPDLLLGAPGDFGMAP